MQKTALWLALAWAVIALGVQLARAWGGGRRQHSRAAGSPWQGLVYNFTAAMSPGHKETAYRHVGEFALGIALHLGVIAVGLVTLLWLVWSRAGEAAFVVARPLAGLGLLSGLVLLTRRAMSPMLRAISTPDDFVAIVATCLFLAAAVLFAGTNGHALFVICATLLLLYLPLGKLRHAVFFWAARADLGLRMGHRGVYPPARIRTERTHG